MNTSGSPLASTPSQTPTQSAMPPLARQPSSQGINPSPSPFTMNQPASPARSISNTSVFTQASAAQLPGHDSDPSLHDTPQVSAMPSLTAASSGTPTVGGVPLYTPPQTPGYTAVLPAAMVSNPIVPPVAGEKRDGDHAEERGREKRRRIAPTLVSDGNITVTSSSTAPPTMPISQTADATQSDGLP